MRVIPRNLGVAREVAVAAISTIESLWYSRKEGSQEKKNPEMAFRLARGKLREELVGKDEGKV